MPDTIELTELAQKVVEVLELAPIEWPGHPDCYGILLKQNVAVSAERLNDDPIAITTEVLEHCKTELIGRIQEKIEALEKLRP